MKFTKNLGYTYIYLADEGAATNSKKYIWKNYAKLFIDGENTYVLFFSVQHTKKLGNWNWIKILMLYLEIFSFRDYTFILYTSKIIKPKIYEEEFAKIFRNSFKNTKEIFHIQIKL